MRSNYILFNKPYSVRSWFTNEGTGQPPGRYMSMCRKITQPDDLTSKARVYCCVPMISPNDRFMRLKMNFLLLFASTMCIASISTSRVLAEADGEPRLADSPYDLISAVNALRTSNGLPAYGIDSILMYTAQSQADFMAVTGNVTHTGPGGIGVTDRLLAAGYPLAGDLSLGGFRSENITSGGEDMSAQVAVVQWTGDAPHSNTMLSSNLTEIGAGVAVSGGRVYYVIDCARPTTAGPPQASTPSGGSRSVVPAGEAAIPTVVVSTPNSKGEVIHEVQAGQSLWQIAIAYDVKIDDIKRLNNLSDNTIFPGDRLLVKQAVITPPPPPTETGTKEAAPDDAGSAMSTPPMTPSSSASTQTLPVAGAPLRNSGTVAATTVGIIALALICAGILTRMGRAKRS